MNPNGHPLVDRQGKHVVRSTIIAALAAVAMLLCLFGIHSAGEGGTVHATSVTHPMSSGHVAGVTHPMSSAHDRPAGGAGAMTDAAASVGVTVVTAAAHSHDSLLSCGGHGLLGCGLMAMTCAVLLVLVSLVFAARPPAICPRLLDAVRRVVQHVRAAPLHIHRPSLTMLSISRT